VAGVLEGLKVLDLSWGIPGPVASMLLADNGAEVTKIEPPGGDPFRALHGYRVWNRGKRSAVLDLKNAEQRDQLLALVKTADVFIESYSPGVTKELGIDYDTLKAINPRLIYCSITGYGEHDEHKDRPAIDALVAARTGHIYESRGTTGGTPHRLAGIEMPLEGMEPPEEDMWAAAPRPGPLFPGVPWVSMGTAYLANLGISAALRARETTGRGQKVSTSLMQGVLLTTIGPWLKAEKADTPNFQTWIVDGRGPKGLFKTKDGRWVHQWVPLPSFILGSSKGDKLEITEEVTKPTEAGMRITPATDDLIILWHYYSEMREAMAKFTGDEWTEHAAKVRVPCQPLLSPEVALQQQTFLDDGCVIEANGIRQVGQVYRMSANETTLAPTAAPDAGADTDAIVAEALAAVGADVPPAGKGSLTHPLAGIRVLDFGFAVAGPFGTQLLGDLGAEVIKINTMYDGFWMANHVGHCCNRGKRSIAINLNDPVGQEIARKLIETADIFQHNMGENAMAKIGLGYDDVKKIKPDIIYCHTRAFEEGDHRRGLPGNDQTGAALGGTDWLDSGLDDDGWGHWTGVSLGDTGNGLLSAISMTQALMHRDRTGEGQFLKTSILYAHLLNASSWVTPDGSERAPRQELDKWCMGYNALYRLYETAEGWIVIAAHTQAQLDALNGALGTSIDVTPSYSMAPLPGDKENIATLEAIFKTKTAAEWFDVLDAAGVPVEVTNKDFCLSVFDDPYFVENEWVTHYTHPYVGREDALGLLVNLSDTPGVIQGPPLVPGQHSREILTELGYDSADIDKFVEANVIGEMSDPHKV
jgi:crotonobetainyl-CoA:carnitine CoA-transferase CaiB-like acyl-CoA transferase